MNIEARRAVEAILMVAEDPVDPHLLAQLIEVSPAELSAAIAELSATYAAEGRGFVIAQVAGGYRFQSHPELAAYVERFVLEGQVARLSTAALETLAIIAYKQPISRAQVAAIRGVNVDGVVRTLEARGYIGEVGRDTGPGNAVLFGTTASFLEKLGLNSLEDLPPIAQFVPGADVVEQLEHGLRFTPDEPDAVPAEGDGEAEVAPAGEPGAATTAGDRDDEGAERAPDQGHGEVAPAGEPGAVGAVGDRDDEGGERAPDQGHGEVEADPSPDEARHEAAGGSVDAMSASDVGDVAGADGLESGDGPDGVDPTPSAGGSDASIELEPPSAP